MSTSSTAARTKRKTSNGYASEVLARVEEARPDEPEFVQAVRGILPSLDRLLDDQPELRKSAVLERLVEPDRVIQFRVTWMDDEKQVHVNRGWRVQFNNAIGPYKGGLRFHPSVNLSVLKFLGFEQIFKNALTGQLLGGGKGGSDFDPRRRSDAEVMRFCQAFMTELFRHIGPDVDVPAGDVNVGSREIGYLFGRYRQLTNRFHGALTGKSPAWGGSLIRTEATGYGCVYFACDMLETRGETVEGKTCLVSGAGNVAQYTIEKLCQLGARVVTVSDSEGFVHDPDGITRDKLNWIKELKNERRGRIREYAEEFKSATFTEVEADAQANPIWEVEAHCAFPSATQNEISGKDAKHLIDNGVMLVCEGANMPSTPEAEDHFIDAGILYGPAKAANAGGVAVSSLEMAQNSQHESWPAEEVDRRLKKIMKAIHDRCLHAAARYSTAGNYFDGANIAGFQRISEAMRAQGLA